MNQFPNAFFWNLLQLSDNAKLDGKNLYIVFYMIIFLSIIYLQ